MHRSFMSLLLFQSTLPAWGATVLVYPISIHKAFQSTLPAWGATCALVLLYTCPKDFNPRSPRGERLP